MNKMEQIPNRPFLLRQAERGDAAALLAIYAPFITDTAVTFEYDVPDEQAFAARIDEISAEYPYLVCERDGKPVGYAYAHRLRERAAYDWDAELSVYLAPEAQGRGVGTAVLACLIDLLELQGLRRLYSCVTLPNEKSIRMQKKLGFADAGVWHASGWKHGAWHDVAWLEKLVGAAGAPEPVVPFPALNGEKIQECLKTYTEKLNMEE